MRNRWFDDENRAYIIYKLEEVEEDFGISKPTAVKIMAELDAMTGIGLTDLINHSVKEKEIRVPSMPQSYGTYMALIQENIEYDILCSRYPDKVKLIDEIISLITDIVSIERETVRINKTDYPYSVVKSIFLKLKEHHMEFVLDSLSKNPVKVGNIKNYLLTMLYNSYCTYHNDAAAYVNHVMNGDDRKENGS